MGPSVPLTGGSVPLTFGVSLRIQDPSSRKWWWWWWWCWWCWWWWWWWWWWCRISFQEGNSLNVYCKQQQVRLEPLCGELLAKQPRPPFYLKHDTNWKLNIHWYHKIWQFWQSGKRKPQGHLHEESQRIIWNPTLLVLEPFQHWSASREPTFSLYICCQKLSFLFVELDVFAPDY